MSERLDRALSALDVGLQESPESHVYGDVAPVVTDVCVRCERRDRFGDSDWCEPCRAYLLGDTDTDPMLSWDDVLPVWTVEFPLCTVHLAAVLGDAPWDRIVTMGVASVDLRDGGWAGLASWVDDMRDYQRLPAWLPLRVWVEPVDALGVCLCVAWQSILLGARALDESFDAFRSDQFEWFAEEWCEVVITPSGANDLRLH
jgi:thiol-disulfide isomerase/thioredoxin